MLSAMFPSSSSSTSSLPRVAPRNIRTIRFNGISFSKADFTMASASCSFLLIRFVMINFHRFQFELPCYQYKCRTVRRSHRLENGLLLDAQTIPFGSFGRGHFRGSGVQKVSPSRSSIMTRCARRFRAIAQNADEYRAKMENVDPRETHSCVLGSSRLVLTDRNEQPIQKALIGNWNRIRVGADPRLASNSGLPLSE